MFISGQFSEFLQGCGLCPERDPGRGTSSVWKRCAWAPHLRGCSRADRQLSLCRVAPAEYLKPQHRPCSVPSWRSPLTHCLGLVSTASSSLPTLCGDPFLSPSPCCDSVLTISCSSTPNPKAAPCPVTYRGSCPQALGPEAPRGKAQVCTGLEHVRPAVCPALAHLVSDEELTVTSRLTLGQASPFLCTPLS